VGVCLFKEAIDGGLKIADGSKDAPLEASVGELGEEAFDGNQEAEVGVKWKVNLACWAIHLRMFGYLWLA
jgi:hypothetical protein